eukprot:gene37-3433_t
MASHATPSMECMAMTKQVRELDSVVEGYNFRLPYISHTIASSVQSAGGPGSNPG